MSSSRPAAVGAVAVCSLLLLAGCLTAPVNTSSDRTASFGASNADNRTYLVTFSLAPTVEGFAVTDANNSTTRYPEASSLDGVPSAAVARAVRVVPLGDDVRTFGFRLDPGEGVGNTVSSLPREVVLVYTVANPALDEPMRTVGLDTCGLGTTDSDLAVRINPGGHINTSSICRG
jgi:hypothetical protein